MAIFSLENFDIVSEYMYFLCSMTFFLQNINSVKKKKKIAASQDTVAEQLIMYAVINEVFNPSL